MHGVDNSQVEDVVQNTFLKAFRKIHQFRNEKSSIKTWLCVIATNQYKDFFKSKKHKNTVSLDALLDAPVVSQGMIGRALNGIWDEKTHIETCQSEMQSTLDDVFAMVERFKPEYQNIFKMKYMDGLDYKEISKKTKISIFSLRQINSRSIREIRSAMQQTV
jgi:RNA polymerase sigma-70 factor (ECF subfamily)